jgi:hypothetical protein
MPLTISHPAASVPLARLGLVFSALVIGSMTPDFPHFIPLLSNSKFSHSMVGLLAYCVPLGLISLGVFHFLIKYPALALLPFQHQQRLSGVAHNFSFGPLHRFLLIILSILLGALTHILWDSFTHPTGWMVKQFIVLKAPVISTGSQSVPTYQFLQHGSTLFGGMLLFYWYAKWYKSAKLFPVRENLIISAPKKLIILVIMGIVAITTAVISGFISIPALQTSLYQRLLIGHIFIVGVSTFTLELMLFSVYWHFNLKSCRRG